MLNKYSIPLWHLVDGHCAPPVIDNQFGTKLI